MNKELLGVTIIGVILLFTFLNTRKPSNIGDLNPIDQNLPRFHAVRGVSDGDGTIKLQSVLDGQFGTLVLRDGELFSKEKPAKPTTGSTTESTENDGDKRITRETLFATFTPDYYLIEPLDFSRLDLGTWIGYKGSEEGYKGGIRFSPVRLLYGAIAADLVASKDSYGGGISFFPPPKVAGRIWSHIGIGAWYTFPYPSSDNDSIGSGWNFGVAFSTR